MLNPGYSDSESESLLPGPSGHSENEPLLAGRGRGRQRMEPLNEFPELPEYNQLIKSVEAAINRDILPERIYQVINFNLNTTYIIRFRVQVDHILLKIWKMIPLEFLNRNQKNHMGHKIQNGENIFNEKSVHVHLVGLVYYRMS